MRVLLVYPVPPPSHFPMGAFRSHWAPTGVAYLASALRRAGHQVRIHVREEQLVKAGLNWQIADERLRDELIEFRPDMVGLSLTTPAMAETAAVAALAKELLGPDVLTVAGGPHPTALPEQTLAECPALDAVVIGEGEQTLVELADHGPGESVTGIAFRRDGQIVRTGHRPPVTDLDSLGEFPYDLFDMDFYTQRDRWLIRWLPLRANNIRTSRGCTNRCRFCAGHLVGGLGVRFHSLDYVIEQVRTAVERFGVEAVHFEDDTLGASPQRLLELCERLHSSGLAQRVMWDGCLRVDQAEPELLAAMKSAGCIQVEYGFESGSTDSLRRLGKNASAALNRRAVRLTREAGLRVYADYMIGLPGETEADFRATLDFMRWARADVTVAARLHPLPGTPIFEALPPAVRDSIRWADYSYMDRSAMRINLTAMPDKRFWALCREFDKYFLRPQLTWELLRDTQPADRASRQVLRRRLRRFAVRHPLRAARLPRGARAGREVTRAVLAKVAGATR